MSGGPYNLRSRTTDPALPADLSPAHFPPLNSSSPNMTPPSSSSREDILLEKLHALTIAMTTQQQERHEAAAQQQQMHAAADARMARLEELVASLQSTRSVEQVSAPTPATTTARTPQLHYVPPVRRQLLPAVPEATPSAPLLPQCPTPSFPTQTPELIHQEVEKYEMKSVMKLMAQKKLKFLRYEDWL